MELGSGAFELVHSDKAGSSGDQAEFTRKKQWNPSRIRIRAALNDLFHAIALPLVLMDAAVAAADSETEEEESPEAAAIREGEHQEKSAAAVINTFEADINAAFKTPVKHNAANGRGHILVRIPRSSTRGIVP